MQEHNIKIKGTPLTIQGRIRAAKVGGERRRGVSAAKTKNRTIKQLTLSVRKKGRHCRKWEPRHFCRRHCLLRLEGLHLHSNSMVGANDKKI